MSLQGRSRVGRTDTQTKRKNGFIMSELKKNLRHSLHYTSGGVGGVGSDRVSEYPSAEV